MRPVERPRLARWLLSILVGPEDRRFVLGDLDEEFDRRASLSPRRARWWYRAQAARAAVPYLLLRSGRRARHLLRDVPSDLWYGLRTLSRTPLMALATVLSLGLGIGAVTSVFTIGNAFLLKDGGGGGSRQGVVAVFTSDDEGSLYDESSLPDLESIRGSVRSLQELAAARTGVVTLDPDGPDGPEVAERLLVELVTDGYLGLTGARPALGRFFAPDEMAMGAAAPVAVISYDEWQNRFQGRTDVLGTTLRLDEQDFTVIGVAPQGLVGRFLRIRVDAWLPIGIPGAPTGQRPTRGPTAGNATTSSSDASPETQRCPQPSPSWMSSPGDSTTSFPKPGSMTGDGRAHSPSWPRRTRGSRRTCGPRWRA